MWLFEVAEEVRVGCLLSQRENRWGIPMGLHEETKVEHVLPLGNSLNRLLRSQEDNGKKFVLRRAAIHRKAVGGCFVLQTEDEAKKEGRALVFVDRCADSEVGVTRVEAARNCTEPMLRFSHQSNGVLREAYEFTCGDGMYIYHPPQVFGEPKRFTLRWTDEQTLELQEVQRRPLRRQPQESLVVAAGASMPRLQIPPQWQGQPLMELTA